MSELDLSGLRRDVVSIAPPRKPMGGRLALIGIAMLILGLLASFAWDYVFPPRIVDSASPRQEVGATAQAAARVVAEAAGWIEPDPFATVVRPLVRGRMDELLVLEGHAVKKDETVIARLASAELLSAFERAQATRELRAARLAEAEQQQLETLAALEQRGELRSAVIAARREYEAVQERHQGAAAALVAATADVAAKRADFEAQELLEKAGSSFPVALAKAKAELDGALARRDAAERLVSERAHEVEQDRLALELAEELHSEPRSLHSAHERAQATTEALRAELAVADAELAIAERELGWCTVLAPMDGVVMKLLAAPGSIVGPEGEGIVSLYDPQHLQARVDVPLAMVAAVHDGQAVAVLSEVTGARVTAGRVLRVQRESDLLKNTLQVKVGLIDPDPSLRPETLCRARFIDEARERDHAAPEGRWWVPTSAVRGGAVYVADPSTSRARRVSVEIIETRDGETLVRAELSATQQVLLEAVDEGDRVQVRKEAVQP